MARLNIGSGSYSVDRSFLQSAEGCGCKYVVDRVSFVVVVVVAQLMQGIAREGGSTVIEVAAIVRS